jgi:ADP-heptose:LPS heptosyltransferase
MPSAEIHFLTKKVFETLVSGNPHIQKVWTISQSSKEISSDLKAERFDHLIDLHKNLRTLGLKIKLKVPSKSFKKLNFEKWLLVNRKADKMPDVHIVERYLDTVRHLGIVNDHQSGDFFINPENELDLSAYLLEAKNFVAVAMGAQFATKCLPTDKMAEALQKIKLPIVLLGGDVDVEKAEDLKELLEEKTVLNLCGELNLQESASVLKQAKVLMTHDTGLMHIAACFDTKIVSIWGNTVPELGMYPYQPEKKNFSIHQVKGLSCRPCSKIGYQKCPKGHFDCMLKQDMPSIQNSLSD